MRNYALTLSQASPATALIPKAAQAFKTLILRRQIRKILLAEGVCPATGLSGPDLRHLLAMPLSCNLAMEIDRLKFFAARNLRADIRSGAQFVMPEKD